MKKTFISLIAFIIGVQFAQSQNYQIEQIDNPVDWVNPLMGTDSNPGLSNGNTYPVIAMPWGMNFWTPQTGNMGHGWAYTYNANKIKGFKQTHQPSPWMNDYGQFSIMPITGKLRFKQEERESWFSHKAEIATPYYYSVYLADHDITTEITPTERAARFRFTFPENDESYIIVDAFDRGSYVKIIPQERKIIGYTTRNSGGVPDNFKNYFVIIFDTDFEISNTFSEAELTNTLESTSKHAGAAIGFTTKKGQIVNAKVASSFISFEQAEINLEEIGDSDFNQLKEKGKAIWNKELSRIEIEGATANQIGTFYSCLYRSLLFPRKFFEFNKEGGIVHYSPYNGEVRKGYMFTDTGFWDTFRSLFPFLNLMYPELSAQMQEGLSNAYDESGWLPEWASPGLRNIMVGNNSASVVSDAYLKNGNLYKYDIENLYDALIHGANNEGPMTAVGRAGAPSYIKLGYVPFDIGLNETAARTLEYAYDDFAIYQLAKALKKPKKEIELYKKRSLNYKNLYDSEYKLMRGKDSKGDFRTPFSPFDWGGDFTEGNSLHYSWSVFHDVQGLIDLMGGEEEFVSQLDTVFSLPPVFGDKYYGGVIHEIREMQIANMGQYAHGNQPIQHMPYLYNYAGVPWKSQYWVRETMDRMYNPNADGYCGDEDNGQTSAWYVFSAMGFYPVAPATDQYVIGTPLFKKTTIHLENGKKIIINAPKNNRINRYINTMTFNGKSYSKNWLSHKELMKGAEIDFDMIDEPNKNRGINKEDFPYSLSNE
ncbi:glycoside hydrolase family 92 protein [Maribacter polysiphoniae]|uniref:Glycoside hydrolase family 92 protein n=1 Tax=Maribacter polysiphoniae TaxID=429344 RepID=A0A316DKT0_9FLAO|nr:GH92 family glycosyl hydrolase [Maribacter polysiphoniae]MBD1263200.1 glycoside hydrolase family 92 protein [Maribacter polysiphoniae]PWK18102.1 putative alpha-1,2-mannosidase [Maribacter polysiphoniae]